VVIGHQDHALFQAGFGVDGDHFLGHDFLDQGMLGIVALENDFAGIIALSADADDFLAIGDQKRADIFLSHHFDGAVDGFAGGNRKSFMVFFGFHQFANSGHSLDSFPTLNKFG